jgi:FixJ family two-component response regulator
MSPTSPGHDTIDASADLASHAVVYVVDDDEAVRDSMRWLLEANGFQVRSFDSAEAFLTAGPPSDPVSCLLLDVRMPGMSGLELQQQLNLKGAMIPVIFITGHGDVPMAVEAMQLGAFDFVQKPVRDQDLLDRIQKALVLDRDNHKKLQQYDSQRKRLTTLTPRERQVMDLMTQGRPNKLMAADLDLSQRTIEIHRAHVMQKMQANSLAQLVRIAIDLS